MSIKTALLAATSFLLIAGAANAGPACKDTVHHRVVHRAIHRTSYVHTKVINRTVVVNRVVNRTIYVDHREEVAAPPPPVEVADESYDESYDQGYVEQGGAYYAPGYSYSFGAYGGPREFYGRGRGGAERYGADGQYGQWHSNGGHSWREGVGRGNERGAHAGDRGGHDGGWHH